MDGYPERLRTAIDGLLDRPGSCTPALRRTVYDYAALRAVGPTSSDGIPIDLVPYMDKVILHAYKVTDQDVERLEPAGFSEDEIFELTLSASFGAAAARLDAGLAALVASS